MTRILCRKPLVIIGFQCTTYRVIDENKVAQTTSKLTSVKRVRKTCRIWIQSSANNKKIIYKRKHNTETKIAFKFFPIFLSYDNKLNIVRVLDYGKINTSNVNRIIQSWHKIDSSLFLSFSISMYNIFYSRNFLELRDLDIRNTYASLRA